MNIPLLFGKIPEPSLAGLGKAGTRYKTCRVPVATLDSYLDRLQRLVFIKVDVEGHELTFLQGARDTIARFRPLIQFESNNICEQYAEFNSFAGPLRIRSAVSTQVEVYANSK